MTEGFKLADRWHMSRICCFQVHRKYLQSLSADALAGTLHAQQQYYLQLHVYHTAHCTEMLGAAGADKSMQQGFGTMAGPSSAKKP